MALGPTDSAASAARAFSVVITAVARAIVGASATPRLAAVETAPAPSGLVRNSTSPAPAVEFRTT